MRMAAWKRAPLKTKMRVLSLWLSHRPYRLKVAYWDFRRRYRSLFVAAPPSDRPK